MEVIDKQLGELLEKHVHKVKVIVVFFLCNWRQVCIWSRVDLYKCFLGGRKKERLCLLWLIKYLVKNYSRYRRNDSPGDLGIRVPVKSGWPKYRRSHHVWGHSSEKIVGKTLIEDIILMKHSGSVDHAFTSLIIMIKKTFWIFFERYSFEFYSIYVPQDQCDCQVLLNYFKGIYLVSFVAGESDNTEMFPCYYLSF